MARNGIQSKASRWRRRPRSYRPRVEFLEARTLLSTYTVDHLADDSVGQGLSGSLRYCITHATDGDDIHFSVTGTINLTGALADMTHSINIEGPGPDQLTVRRDTGGAYRIFTVASGANVAITGLTISNGLVDVPNWGAGINNSGTLTLNNTTVSGNSSFPTAPGGGIYNRGTLMLNFATVSGNSAGVGGGIYNDNGGAAIVDSSTVSGNASNGGGGGIFSAGGTVTLNNSTLSGSSHGGIFVVGGVVTLNWTTISGNSNYQGGGVYNLGGTLNAFDTIIAGNAASSAPDLSGTLTSQGHNLIGNSQGGSGFDTTDLLDIDPLLGPLQDNGGATFTMALLPGSPAIDAGDNTDAPDWDQRGEGYPRIVNDIIDIGAFEVQNDSGGSARLSRSAVQLLSFDVAALRDTLSAQPVSLPVREARPLAAAVDALFAQDRAEPLGFAVRHAAEESTRVTFCWHMGTAQDGTRTDAFELFGPLSF